MHQRQISTYPLDIDPQDHLKISKYTYKRNEDFEETYQVCSRFKTPRVETTTINNTDGEKFRIWV